MTTYNYAENEPVGHIDLWGLQKAKPSSTNYSGYPSNSQSKSDPSIGKTAAFMARHPVAGGKIGYPTKHGDNISSIALRFGDKTTTNSVDNNAVRHVVWQAIVTAEFGEETAIELGNAHEDKVLELSTEGPFTLEDADIVADMNNNIIGRAVGLSNPNGSAKDFALSALNIFISEGLFVAKLNSDDTFSVERTKISEEDFKAAINAILNLNTKGRTEREQYFKDLSDKYRFGPSTLPNKPVPEE